MREEIIRMAREAGFGIAAFNAIDGYEVVTSDGKIITDEIERFYSLVAAAEQERCAKVCEEERDRILSKQSGREYDPVDINLRMTAWGGADPCAAAIRAL